VRSPPAVGGGGGLRRRGWCGDGSELGNRTGEWRKKKGKGRRKRKGGKEIRLGGGSHFGLFAATVGGRSRAR
jgi:hypothetical protein